MKKIIYGLIAGVLLVSSPLSAKEIYGKPWVNTNIVDNLPEDAGRLQDDFNLSVSYDWYKTSKIPSNMSSFGSFSEVQEDIRADIISMLKGKNPASHEEQISQTLFNQALDWKQRNKAGIKPALPRLKQLQGTKNLDELSALLSMKNSPFGACIGMSYDFIDSMDSNVYIPIVGEDLIMLPDADWYTENLSEDAQKRLEINYDYFTKLLVKFGYKKNVAKKMLDSIFDFEMKYAPVSYGTTACSQLDFYSKIYNVVSVKEFEEKYPNLPVIKQMMNDTDGFFTRIQDSNPESMKVLNELFVEKNFEVIKNIAIINYIVDCSSYLDRQCYNIKVEYYNKKYGSNLKESDEEIAYALVQSLGMAIGKVWVEKYFSPEIKEDVTNITKEIIGIFDGRIRKLEWMSESTKKTALEKLHSINYVIGYPDVWKDYSALQLPVNYKDGSLYDSIQKINLFENNYTIEKCKKPVDKLEWGMTPQTVNAYYDSTNNSINILAGILNREIYQYDWPIEKKLGGIGIVIGHELTHGFDAHGSQFDKDGNMVNWWTEEDSAAFDAKNQEIIKYFSSFEVVPGVMNNGLLCIGEIVADIGGITFSADYGSKIDNFDYELFFSQFAKIWRDIASYEIIKNQAQFDAHPIGFIRVNATVQQIQAFYDTFGIKEGDKMYLAPEDRYLVW